MHEDQEISEKIVVNANIKEFLNLALNGIYWRFFHIEGIIGH